MYARPARRGFRLFSTFTLLLCVAGCNKEPEIASYDVPRDSSPSRMIAAIVPRESQAWFIKATGPEAAMEGLADDLRQFVSSIELPTDEPNAIKWNTPEGWTEGKPRAMREATLVTPGDAAIELAISKLGYDGNTDEYLLANVNRWLGQLGLEPAEKIGEAKGVEIIDLDDGQAWLLDAVGQMDASSMRPPMMSGNAPNRSTTPPSATPPSATPPRATPPPAAPPTAEASLSFDAADEWKELPRGSMGSRSYQVGEGAEAVVIKFSDYPPVGMMADPLMNINRWRGQLGASDLEQEDLKEQTETVAIADTEGILTEIVAPDDSQAMLAAMAKHKDRVWFFQLTGGVDAVQAQREMFVDWIDSVEIVSQATEGESE